MGDGTGTNRIIDDLTAFLTDPSALWSVLVALAFGAACTALGVFIGRRTRLLEPTAATADQLGVGLALGLLTSAVVYATVRSGGASTYVPSAVFLAMAIALGGGQVTPRLPDRRWLGVGALAAVAVVGAAVMYGVTVAPSPRAGAQPVEFMDEAYYGVLSSTLRQTGIENVFAPAGFDTMPGVPAQSFYHWGEAWLGALIHGVPGVGAIHASQLVTFPLVIVATAAVIAGVAANSVPRTFRREALVLAAIGTIAIAPIPLLLDWHFDWWARPIGFAVTTYGLTYVIVALGLQWILTPPSPSRPVSLLMIGALVSALVASHIVLAALAAVAISSGWIHRWVMERRRGARQPLMWGVAGASVLGGVATLAWGLLTGHGFADAGAMVGVSPFGEAWLRAIGLTLLGAGVLVIGPALALRPSLEHERLGSIAVGVTCAVAAGALLWGFRLAEFNYFHAYFGAIAVFLTPVAVIAIVRAIADGRTRMSRATPLLVVVLVGQSAIGLGATVQRLYEFGPGHYQPVPLEALAYVRALPSDAKLAYACANFEEAAAWDARLISLTAHTGRPVVPMCFQSDIFRNQVGHSPDPALANPFFEHAPQRVIYPALDDPPTTEEIVSFMDDHGIEYVWVDPSHPNILVPHATEIFRAGQFAVLQLP